MMDKDKILEYKKLMLFKKYVIFYKYISTLVPHQQIEHIYILNTPGREQNT